MALQVSGAIFYKFIDPKVGTPSGGQQGGISGQPWQPATVYALGAIVRNGGFWYRCSVAGTSAAAPGPSPNTLADNTATWVLIGPASGVYGSEAAATHELGYQAMLYDQDLGRGFAMARYVKFTAAANPGDFVIIDGNGQTCVQTPAAAPGANKVSIIGISMGTQANGTYGWVLIQGTHDQANTAAGGAVGTLIAGSATVGRGTSAAQTANYLFEGSVQRAAGVVGTGTVELYWPVCSGR
jgi:hypothetical protein